LKWTAKNKKIKFKEACAAQGGEIASASDDGISEFISGDKALRKKKVLILSPNGKLITIGYKL